MNPIKINNILYIQTLLVFKENVIKPHHRLRYCCHQSEVKQVLITICDPVCEKGLIGVIAFLNC